MMNSMIQKKITFRREQSNFLANCKEYGFADQSTLIRTALDVFIKKIKREQRRINISQKAQELATLYCEDSDLTAFTAIDGDNLHETD